MYRDIIVSNTSGWIPYIMTMTCIFLQCSMLSTLEI